MQDRMRPVRAGCRLVLIGGALLLARCAAVPETGPSKSALLGEAATKQGMAIVELTPRAIAILRQSAPQSFEGQFPAYRPAGQQVIGVGDKVRITLWEAAEGGLFSSPAVTGGSPGSRSAVIPDQEVARDGAITVPYAGRVAVIGRTPPQVEDIIVARLSGLAIKPQALVSLTQNISNTATVIGEVRNGGRVPLSTRGDRLLEVIAAAGGPSAPVQEITIRLTRDQHTVGVPMEVLLQRPEENVYAQGGDTIALVREPQSFMMFGAVQRTGQITFDKPAITLADAVAKAGGLLSDRADPAGLFVLRYEDAALARRLAPAFIGGEPGTPVPVVYRLDLREPLAMLQARQVAMRDNDIVYVSDAGLVDVQKVLGVFQAITAPASTAASTAAAVK